MMQLWRPYWLLISLSLSFVFISLPLSLSLLLLLSIVSLAMYLHVHRAPAGTGKADRFKRLLVGHRGCRRIRHAKYDHEIPENSMESFRWALDHGAEAIELDCHLTKDGEMVVFHDYDTKRLLTTDARVCDLTLAEIQSHEFRAYAGLPKSEGEGLPSLKERAPPSLRQVLLLAKEKKTVVFVESKDYKYSSCVKAAEKIVELAEELDMTDSIVVISFFFFALYHIRRLQPRVLTCFLYDSLPKSIEEFSHGCGIQNPVLSSLLSHLLTPLLYHTLPLLCTHFLGVSMVGPLHSLLSAMDISFWQERGIEVYTWTVNSKELIPFFLSQGVSVGTDDCREDYRKR